MYRRRSRRRVRLMIFARLVLVCGKLARASGFHAIHHHNHRELRIRRSSEAEDNCFAGQGEADFCRLVIGSQQLLDEADNDVAEWFG